MSQTPSMRVEHGMLQRGRAPTPLTKDGVPERAMDTRLCIALFNCLAQTRPGLVVATRVLSQQTSCPTGGTDVGVVHVIRYLQ